MKKLMLMIAVACAAVLAQAKERKIHYYTNAVQRATKCAAKKSLNHFILRRVSTNDAAKVDEILSAAGLFSKKLVPSRKFPKMYALWAAWAQEQCPGYYAYRVAKRNLAQQGKKAEEPDDDTVVNAVDGLIFHMSVKGQKQKITRIAMRHVRKQLHSEGLSYLTKDGVNPVQARIDALSAALDAPRMAGLKEALAGCGLTLRTNPNALLPTDEEVAALKTKIISGEKILAGRDHRMNKLLITLGVAEYNKFVKQYNGEE